MHRPAVVDDEADAERRAVLANLAAEVVTAYLDRCSARTHECRPQCGVERDVMVARPREPVPRVPAAAPTDEGARPPPEPCALETVDPAAMVEDARRIDADGLDCRGAVRGGVGVER